MNKVTLLGIDIAKNIFQLHGVDTTGKGVLKKKLKRRELASYIAKMPACTVVMEACGGAHYWARTFREFGHEVKLISPQFVKPFVKTNKNDAQDAQAITEAASRPDMRFVPIKKEADQDIQSVHRIRERLKGNRTALTNQARGLLAEYGIVVPKGTDKLRRLLSALKNEDSEIKLTQQMRELCGVLYEELVTLEKRLKIYATKIKQIFAAHPICQKLEKLEGVGPITATILLTALSDPSVFKNGRHFAAFLGLVPKQHSSGGKERLLGISKRGDKYIRTLLIHGGRSVVRTLGKKTDNRSVWVRQLKERRGYNRAAVAVANKNARIAWSLVNNDTTYQKAA